MPLELGIPTNEDFEKFVPMMFDATGKEDHLVNAIYPNGFAKEGQAMTVRRFLSHKEHDESVRWCKVTDTASDEIVGVALWNIYKSSKPKEGVVNGPPGTWDNETEKEFAQDLSKAFMQKRWKFMRENHLPIMCLSPMTVAPQHQHRGAGTLMMRWGTELADKTNAVCVLESTLAGRWLYEQWGFKVQEHWTLQVSEKFANRPKTRMFFMVRPRRHDGPGGHPLWNSLNETFGKSC